MALVCNCPPALLATCLESEVNVAVAFHGRSGLLDEYCLLVSKALREFNATYVIDWDAVCKGLLRGEVQMFQTFAAAGAEQEGDDAKDECSDDEIEQADGKATPPKAPKNAAVKAPTPKPKAPHSDGKTLGKSLGPFHQRVQQAKANVSKGKRK